MKSFIRAAVFLVGVASVIAGQIDVAWVRFPEAIEAARIQAALQGTSLASLADAEQLQSQDGLLRHGRVIFFQSLPEMPAWNMTTRIEACRIQCEGSLHQGLLSLAVRREEGVDAGLRRFSERSQRGSAKLQGTSPIVLGVVVTRGRSSSHTRSGSESRETTHTYALLAARR